MIYTYHKMQASKLRSKIERLDRRRRRLLKKLMCPEDMVAGSIYQAYKRCGNPNCRCAKGRRHGPFTSLSVTQKGKRRLIFVRRDDEAWVRTQATRYREYQKMMARVRKMNDEIFELLKKLRDNKLKNYPTVRVFHH